MTDISLIPILASEGWKVLTRSKLKSMKKEELIEQIEILENNYGATIERANNSYSYGKSEIERLEKENAELKALIEKMICCGNCGNVRCTSKYRGNSAYHRQEDGYACADNEDWTPRLDNKK